MHPEPEITVLTGPGNHAEKLVEAVLAFGKTTEVFRYYPQFEHQVYNEKGDLVYSRKARWANRLARYGWALCIRLAFLKKRNYHVYLSFVLYDRWASKTASGSSRLLWAWSQTGKKTMQRFNKNRLPVILEKPMVHVDTWTSMLEKEYLQHTGSRFHAYYFCKALRQRMAAEYALAQKIVVLSGFAQDSFIQKGFDRQKIYRANLYADAKLFTPGETPPAQGFHLLFVGRIDVLKGIPALARAFESLRGLYPETTLTLVGEVKPEVQPHLNRLGKGITITGYKKPGELATYYRNAHLLVLPSVQESFGLVMLEALACGTPVLASSHTGAPDLAPYGRQVTVFDPMQEGDLTKKLQDLYKNRYISDKNETILQQYNRGYYTSQVHGLIQEYLKPAKA